jgi:hypothetical protein
MKGDVLLFIVAVVFGMFLIGANLAAAGDLLQFYEDGRYRIEFLNYHWNGAIPFTPAWHD